MLSVPRVARDTTELVAGRGGEGQQPSGSGFKLWEAIPQAGVVIGCRLQTGGNVGALQQVALDNIAEHGQGGVASRGGWCESEG